MSECPNCKKELPFDLKKQVRGNNCNCGFPFKKDRRFIRRNIIKQLERAKE